MKHIRMMVWTVLAASALAAPRAWAQGSLTPPGAPGQMMRTLEQVEPRMPISSLPITLNQAGSYYLTTDLVTTNSGVMITADRVTLDLMGFMIKGSTNGYGVQVFEAVDVEVRNGFIWGFDCAIRCDQAQNCRFAELILARSKSQCIYFNGSGAGGECRANVVSDCLVRDSEGQGIYFDSSPAGQCLDNVITRCLVSGNNSWGIQFDANPSGRCRGNRVQDCTVNGSGDYGIYFAGSGSGGECAGNRVSGCTINGNKERGIYLSYADGNRVEGNHITYQAGTTTTYGVWTSMGSGNFILGNTAIGHTNNYQISANDTYGPIVTNAGELASTGDASHPWANFSR